MARGRKDDVARHVCEALPPRSGATGYTPRVAKVPAHIRWVFWDVDAARLDTVRSADYIVPRIPEFGGMAEVRWAIATYAMEGSIASSGTWGTRS